MDAMGCAQIITAWEQELSKPNSSETFPDCDPCTIFDFTEEVTLEDGWLPAGWIAPSIFEVIASVGGFALEMYKYPRIHGSIYIPSSIVERWVKIAAKELEKGDWVSRNDLVTAWIFKHEQGASFLQDRHWNTLFAAMCPRGRHPALPLSYITNTAKSIVVPPMTSATVRRMSVTQIALQLRKSIEAFKDEDYVAKFVAHEFRSMRKHNGFPFEIPQGRMDARTFGTTSWAKIGLTGPKLSKTSSTLANLTFNTGGQCATIIDDSAGNWRVNVKMSVQSWEAVQKQMDVENELVKSSAE
jgi:hypothetical protein